MAQGPFLFQNSFVFQQQDTFTTLYSHLQMVKLKDSEVTWLNFSYILAAIVPNCVVTWGIGMRAAIWAPPLHVASEV